MTTNMIARGVPARLKGKIARRVEKEKSTLNDVVVSVLAAHFQIDFEPSGRRSPRARSGETEPRLGPYPNIVLEVPVELKRRIDVEAATSGDSIRNVVVAILADEFGEPFEPTGRWLGRAATA